MACSSIWQSTMHPLRMDLLLLPWVALMGLRWQLSKLPLVLDLYILLRTKHGLVPEHLLLLEASFCLLQLLPLCPLVRETLSSSRRLRVLFLPLADLLQLLTTPLTLLLRETRLLVLGILSRVVVTSSGLGTKLPVCADKD